MTRDVWTMALVAGLAWGVIGLVRPGGAIAQSPGPKGTEVLRDLAYLPSAHRLQTLDLYLPPGEGVRALVVYIHGGGWESGDKANPAAMGMLWEKSMALASINYRLSGVAPFPAQLEDCKAAIRWLRVNAARYRLDPDRIGVWGNSAGGHLAALVAVTADEPRFDIGPNKKTSCAVSAVVDCYGPTDLSLYRTSRPDDTLGRLFRGAIQNRTAQVQAANPIAYVSKDREIPPIFIAHGDADRIVPLEHSEKFEAALTAAGKRVTLQVMPRQGHSVITREAEADARKFLREALSAR
jgi:acetyl esterase/lipase